MEIFLVSERYSINGTIVGIACISQFPDWSKKSIATNTGSCGRVLLIDVETVSLWAGWRPDSSATIDFTSIASSVLDSQVCQAQPMLVFALDKYSSTIASVLPIEATVPC